MYQFIKKYIAIDDLIVFFICILFFHFIYINVESDIPLHVNISYQSAQGERGYFPNFLYYLLSNGFGLFKSNLNLIVTTTLLITSISTTLKYSISKAIFLSLKLKELSPWFIRLLSVALLVYVPIPNVYDFMDVRYYMLGRLNSSIWHNTTVIFMIPFSLLLFWIQIKAFKRDYVTNKMLFAMSALVLLNVFIKPSFIFVYLPITGCWIFVKYIKDIKQLLRNLIPVFVGGLYLIYSVYSIFFTKNTSTINEEANKLMVSDAFEVWSHFVPVNSIPIIIVMSLLFPLVYVLLRTSALKDQDVVYSGLLLLLGILITIFVKEEGPRKYHFNLSWQNSIAAYLFLLMIIKNIFINIKSISKFKIKLFATLFSVHLMFGVVYIIRILTGDGYY